MTGTDNENNVGLPEALRGQFAALEKRLWTTETLTSVGSGLSAVLLSLLALFISDRLWNTPPWFRVALTGLALAGVAWAAAAWLRDWVFRRRDQRALALLVQARYRGLGDRLLGIVELANERERPPDFSPALYRAAIGQVANEATRVDFGAAVDTRGARFFSTALLGLALTALVPVLIAPRAALNVLQRWASPTSKIPRFTLVTLEGLPKKQIVAHGEPFEIACQVQYRSFWKPRRGLFQLGGQPTIQATITGHELKVRLPGQVRPGTLEISVGDARASIGVDPVHRPSLKTLSAAIQLPGYLRRPALETNSESGSLTVLEGSRVSFAGKTSRALAKAQMQIADHEAQPLTVQQDGFSSPALDLAGANEAVFTWTDQVGLSSPGPWRLQIVAQKDSAPTPELPGLMKETAILHTEVLDLKAAARDDFGVRELGVKWQVLNDGQSTNTPPDAKRSAEAPTPLEQKFESVFPFSPASLGLPPDSVLELRAFATDFFPDRTPAETATYRIHVLGNERHAELVRQNLESLLARLEEVTRFEEGLTQKTRELQQLPHDKLDANDTAERIASAKEDQNQNAANLGQLADEGRKTLREAFRNPVFPERTLREWAKNLHDMQQISDEAMRQVAKSLKTAEQNAEGRPEQLSQAVQKEEEVLEALEQMQRRVNKGLDQLQALTLAQRLRKIASDEKDIAARLLKIVPEIIGMMPRELPGRFKNTEANLASDQSGEHQETTVIHGEIGRFFERTQKETYGQVSKEMTESHVADELDQVRGLIEDNISMDAIQRLATWSDRLNAWANLLEPKSGSSGGGGDGEGGSSDESLIKELMGLLRARDREINLRQRTALLESQKAQTPTYAESAKALATGETDNREAVARIQGDNPIPALEFPLQDIIDAMQGALTLLNKPQTDRETETAQTKSIELLSDVINLINESQQKSQGQNSPQNSRSEEMSFLMKMMAPPSNPAFAVGVNPRGGGSLAGGTTDRTSTRLPGNPNAKEGESRTVNRASGSAANAPVEFREALENYYRALEKLEKK
jgi:hypothetical protein